MISYCKRCLYPSNHPLGLVLDDEGVCSGCRVHEEKYEIDWDERFNELKKNVESYRSKSGNFYDCIVPVCGAKDSYYIVDVVKNKLGLNPLLVSYNKQFNTDLGIRNLAYLRTLVDGDYMSMTVNPEKIKKITRVTLKEFGSIYWHCIAGETVFPVQVAVKLRIPLIIWGAHQGLDQVGMFSHLDDAEMSRRYRKDHDLMGVEAEDLLQLSADLDENDVNPFIYPDDNELASVGVRGIYLGNYLKWDSKKQHDEMIEKYDYQTSPQLGTFDIYNHVDCHHYASLHDYIKVLKHGYGKVTDHATREIRLKRISRDQGIALIERYKHNKIPEDASLMADWLGISLGELTELIETHRNDELWMREGNYWKSKHKIESNPQADKRVELELDTELDHDFHENMDHSPNFKKEYTLIGKGYIFSHDYYEKV